MVPSSLYLKSDILVEMIVWTYRAGYKGRNGIKRLFFFNIFAVVSSVFHSFLFPACDKVAICFVYALSSNTQRPFCGKTFFSPSS